MKFVPARHLFGSLVLGGLGLFVFGAVMFLHRPARAELDIPEEKVQAAIEKRKAEKRKTSEQLESVLVNLEKEAKKGAPQADAFIQQRKLEDVAYDGMVRVQLVAPYGEDASAVDRAAVTRVGGKIVKAAGNAVMADVPFSSLSAVSRAGGVAEVRIPQKLKSVEVTSEGVQRIGASAYQSAGLTGAGVKVAVIDLSFRDVPGQQAAGELPTNLESVDCTGGECIPSTFPNDTEESDYHGTLVSEIVHDVAPGASLLLLKIAYDIDLYQAAAYAAEHGAKIISMSLGAFNENFFDGTCDDLRPLNPVCIANEAMARGVLWVNAAGNEADIHYFATFTDADEDRLHDVNGTSPYVFLTAEAGEPIAVNLTWDDWPVSANDYDLYLIDSNGNLIAWSDGAQTGGQMPVETLIGYAPAAGTYGLVITNYEASGGHRLDLRTLTNQELEPKVPGYSLMNPADNPNVLAVGAVAQEKWNDGTLESFSSRGPNTAGQVKPDLVGPDNVSSAVQIGWPLLGTSFATPHVAGAAALVLQQHPDYTPLQLMRALAGSATDIGQPGPDNDSGYGKINLAPLLSASPEPQEPLRVNVRSPSEGSLISTDTISVNVDVEHERPLSCVDFRLDGQPVPASAWAASQWATMVNVCNP